MTRKSFYLLTLCWLAYFTVPLINNVGVINGTYIMLCIKKGVMIHDAPTVITTTGLHNPHAHHQVSAHQVHSQQMSLHAHHMDIELEDTSYNNHSSHDQTAEDHEAEGCPCIHFFFNTTLHLFASNTLIKAPFPIVDGAGSSTISPTYIPQARAPPLANYSSNHLIILT